MVDIWTSSKKIDALCNSDILFLFKQISSDKRSTDAPFNSRPFKIAKSDKSSMLLVNESSDCAASLGIHLV